MPQPKTVLHVITGIDVGGAEFMLLRTIEHSDRTRFRHLVVSLKGRGALATRIESAGVKSLHCLKISGPVSALRGFVELCRLIRRERVDAVQTWLAHGTLFGSLAALAAGNRKILWCIHTGNQDPSRIAFPVRVINRLLAILSRFAPKIIVSVSRAASDHCVHLGFPGAKMRQIPNGTDTETFRPNPNAGAELRASLAIPGNVPVVGIVGRNTREKDFDTFFKSAVQVQRALPEVHFLLCGKGLEPGMKEAVANLPSSSCPENFHFAGLRQDIASVYNACNLVVLTSFSEAFPLVLGEAMACGVPVAATDVGDCRALVEDGGLIASPGQPSAIGDTWIQILTLPAPKYQALSIRARQRILEHFAMRPCIERYEAIYDELSLNPAKGKGIIKPSTAAAATPDPIT